MKFFVLIALCFIMGIAGYLFYDGIIPPLLHSATGVEAVDPLVRTVTIEGKNGETKEVTLDLNTILPTQYPRTVTLNQDIEVVSEDGSLSETFLAGTVLIPRNVKDGELIVEQAESLLRGLIPFSASDFESQLALNISAPKETPVTSPQTPDPTPPKEAPSAIPAAILAGEPSNIPKSGSLTEGQIVELMQRSVVAKEVTEFTAEQVKEWKKDADETLNNETLQVGRTTIEVETTYGTMTLKAKAFVKNGAIVRWIWPRSGNNIR